MLPCEILGLNCPVRHDVDHKFVGFQRVCARILLAVGPQAEGTHHNQSSDCGRKWTIWGILALGIWA